jgi:hypothetical protein
LGLWAIAVGTLVVGRFVESFDLSRLGEVIDREPAGGFPVATVGHDDGVPIESGPAGDPDPFVSLDDLPGTPAASSFSTERGRPDDRA